jgi:hypothetical protein
MHIISPSYHPAQAAIYGGSRLRPLQNEPTYSESEHYCLTVQPFRAGGYEATFRLVDLQKAADLAALPRKFGKRIEPGERTQDSLNVSRQRAKSMVRKRVKDMGANRLCTLTVRQNDEIGYMSPEDWHKSFARYVRLLRKAGLMNDYLAVMEPHKKGLERLGARAGGAALADPLTETPNAIWDIPLHIHFVTRSEFKMPINLMRKCWAIACGRDSNIDVQWLRVKNGDDSAIEKTASYVSKYITKGLAEFERFNKKRYWAAGDPLLEKGRTWLQSRDFRTAADEVMVRLQIGSAEFQSLIVHRRIFTFPDGSGFWLNFRPCRDPSPPPF